VAKDRHNFLAVDLGASSGRVLLGSFTDKKLELSELHRFMNGPVKLGHNLYWNALGLWSDIQNALSHYARDHRIPLSGIGVDTWGVDFGLLDKSGNLIGNPQHYRDPRTDGQMDAVFGLVPKRDIYARSGIQFMQINTLYQLYSIRMTPQLYAAETLLMMPDLFNYWLTGEVHGEVTIASTSQMLDARSRTWNTDLLEHLGLPSHILPPLVTPGTVLGTLHPGVAKDTRLSAQTPIIAPASHDTASAVAAIPSGGLFISSGTWSLVGTEVAEPVLSDAALARDFTNESGVDGTVRLLKNTAGLWLLLECRRVWVQEGYDYAWDELLAQARRAPAFRSLIDPAAETFLNPENMVEAIRTACRTSGETPPESIGEVVRCCLESLALKFRSVLDDLEALIGKTLPSVHLVGGGANNALLCQYTANACNRPVTAGPVEATALGNLMVQALAQGLLPSLEAGRSLIAASSKQTLYTPKDSDAWEEAYARFKTRYL
jgi:rhamnulokinase